MELPFWNQVPRAVIGLLLALVSPATLTKAFCAPKSYPSPKELWSAERNTAQPIEQFVWYVHGSETLHHSRVWRIGNARTVCDLRNGQTPGTQRLEKQKPEQALAPGKTYCLSCCRQHRGKDYVFSATNKKRHAGASFKKFVHLTACKIPYKD